MRIILFLVLVDLEDMVGSMRRDQPPNGGFRQMGIDSAEECSEVVGIRGQVGKCGILLRLIPCNGGLGVFSHCSNVDIQQSSRISATGLHRRMA